MDKTGLIVSFVCIGMILAIAVILSRMKKIKPEFIRKFIHVGVSNWWFLLLWGFDDIRFAVIGPVFFVLGNAVAVFSGAADILGITDRRRNYGLIYYPISILILVVLGFQGILPLCACGIGVLSMGYGDGFAAVIGKRWGHRRIDIWHGGKTYLGSAVMFAICALVAMGFSIGYQLESLWTLTWWLGIVVVAMAATLLEAFTPLGLDNLTVPLGTALVAALVLVR